MNLLEEQHGPECLCRCGAPAYTHCECWSLDVCHAQGSEQAPPPGQCRMFRCADES